MSEYSKNNIKNAVLTANTAQSVSKHLRELASNRAHVLSRWIWELLQNARDAFSGDSQLDVLFERRSDDLTFIHNGRGFRQEEIAHLIYHGSTKSDDDASLGRFGSGFLTTHLLSPKIAVAGQLEDGRSFNFELARQGGDSPEALRQSMDAAWNSFAPSDAPLADPLPEGFYTRFRYPITTEDAVSVVTEGLQTLKACAPLVLVFNTQFNRIRIDDLANATEFAVTHRRALADNEVTEVSVVRSHEDCQTDERYLTAEVEGAAIALRVVGNDDGTQRCVPEEGPRLYLGFPLVGTDRFSLPTAANSFMFGPTEPRDGIYLGQADDETNRVNQQLVRAALALHVKLIYFAAANGYANAAILATVPPVKEQSWQRTDWLRQAIQDELIAPLRETPSVVPVQGNALAPKNAVLPRADDTAQVLELRRLLHGMEHTTALLPSPEEAKSWSDAVASWESICGDTATFEEAWDGHRLAEEVARKTEVANQSYGSLERLCALLIDQDTAVQWLDELCGFLYRDGLFETLRTLSLVLDQAGYLDRLQHLYRDVGIDEELKDIADDLLNIGLRCELRDTRMVAVSEDAGKGDYDSVRAVERILKELRESQGETHDVEKRKEASGRLLAWMVRNDRIGDIDHFPVWSEAHEGGDAEVIWLERDNVEETELPLSPTPAWPPELQDFSDLFPQSRILAGSYFDSLPETALWQRLAEQKLVRTDVIYRRHQKHNFKDSPPDEPLTDEGEDHMSTSAVELVDVTHMRKDRIGVMSRVRDSAKRAKLLWRFLTEYVIPKNSASVDPVETDCECGQRHSYYSAAWLTPVALNSWVPLGGDKRGRATARSLAKLLAIDESVGSGVVGDGHALKLLGALGVTQLELMMEWVAKSDEAKRSLDADLARILTSTDGDLAPVSKFVEDLQSDTGLLAHLDERRERVRTTRMNRDLGAIVECLVKESVEGEGFIVRRTGIGSDYEIEFDLLDEEGREEVGVEVTRSDGRTWLVEIKATRGNDVRMSLTQAKKANEEGERLLLCVVPVSPDSAMPEADQVRTAMRFVRGIGEHVRPFCDEADDLEKRRQAATSGRVSADGVRLEVVGGKARICVDHTLWRDATELGDLVRMLGSDA